MERVATLVSEKAVVVFTASNCSMGDVVFSLLNNMGVSVAVHELDKDPQGREMKQELARRMAAAAAPGATAATGTAAATVGTPTLPAVFVGGKLVGGTARVMALHLAGAIWL